jgi:hypothetical protein
MNPKRLLLSGAMGLILSTASGSAFGADKAPFPAPPRTYQVNLARASVSLADLEKMVDGTGMKVKPDSIRPYKLFGGERKTSFEVRGRGGQAQKLVDKLSASEPGSHLFLVHWD